MADNTTTNPGAGGDTFAADDIGGVKHQRVKIEHGADGSATDVSSGSPLPVNQQAALPAGSNNIGQVDPRGNVAHDAADSGNPVKVGGRAATVFGTAVATNDRTDFLTDRYGRQFIAVAPIDQRVNGLLNLVNSTAADLVAAPGANVAIVINRIIVVNGHASVGTKVEIRDGTTVKHRGWAAANGGGYEFGDASDILFVATANTAVTARCITTGSDVDVFVSGYKIPV